MPESTDPSEVNTSQPEASQPNAKASDAEAPPQESSQEKPKAESKAETSKGAEASDESIQESKPVKEKQAEIVEPGKISQWLTQNGFEHESLAQDHQGVEVLKVDREVLIPFATALYAYGFNYLRSQGGYDAGPGEDLVSVYDLTKLTDSADRPEEVRVKVFLSREDPRVPSVYWIWKSADWQERETYDMYGIVYEGHPNLKRLLMPEDWVGWPLRKDYISPDFYELQNAY